MREKMKKLMDLIIETKETIADFSNKKSNDLEISNEFQKVEKSINSAFDFCLSIKGKSESQEILLEKLKEETWNLRKQTGGFLFATLKEVTSSSEQEFSQLFVQTEEDIREFFFKMEGFWNEKQLSEEAFNLTFEIQGLVDDVFNAYYELQEELSDEEKVIKMFEDENKKLKDFVFQKQTV